jgi:hypothetical protein
LTEENAGAAIFGGGIWFGLKDLHDAKKNISRTKIDNFFNKLSMYFSIFSISLVNQGTLSSPKILPLY